MLRYLVTRLMSMIPVVLLATVAVFSLLYLSPGDPVRLLVPSDEMANISVERLDEIREELGLNRPVPVQYLDWLWNALHGDLGKSIRYNRPVSQMLLNALPVTIEMGALALLFSLMVSIPVGILSARRPNSPEDFVATTFALLGVSTPNFWLAIMLILVFTAWLGWLPAAGFVRFTDNPLMNLKYMILPALTMSGEQMALSMRMTRSSFLETLAEDYLTTARAKGLQESDILMKHAFRPAMIPVVTVIGLSIGAVLSGAFIIESVFSVPGLGKLGVDAIFKRDFPVVQGVTLVTALMFLTVNLLVDIIYVYIDPRIAHIGSSSRNC